MSKYKFKITYRNEDRYGHYWSDNRYTVSVIAETLEQAKQKLDEIEKNDYDMHKNILAWEAEEITEEKDKEIERLNNLIKELDDMFYETFRISQNGYYSISEWELKEFTNKIKELKGVDKE